MARKQYKKKSFVRKKKKKMGTVSFLRQPTLMPDALLVKMRYVETIHLAPSVTGAAHIFRANSVYDPNLTGVGHKPNGNNQLSAFYDHYTVLGSKINIKTSTAAPSTTPSYACGVYLADDSAAITTYDTIAEQGKGRYKISTSGDGSINLSNTFSAKKYFGVTDTDDNRDLRGVMGSAGTNPPEEAMFVVWAQSMTGGATSNVDIIVQIEYICKLQERKELTQS